MSLQVHMPKLVQPKTHDTASGVQFDAKRFVMVYCGLHFHKDDVESTFRYGYEQPLRVSRNLELVTCKKCLLSYSREVIGGGRPPVRKPSDLRKGLIQAIEQRIASGIPLNEHDLEAARWVARILRMDSPV